MNYYIFSFLGHGQRSLFLWSWWMLHHCLSWLGPYQVLHHLKLTLPKIISCQMVRDTEGALPAIGSMEPSLWKFRKVTQKFPEFLFALYFLLSWLTFISTIKTNLFDLKLTRQVVVADMLQRKVPSHPWSVDRQVPLLLIHHHGWPYFHVLLLQWHVVIIASWKQFQLICVFLLIIILLVFLHQFLIIPLE